MPDRFRGSLFDLSLNLGSWSRVIDDDAELVVVNEEPTCHTLTVGIERDCLDGQVTDMSTDDDPHETEQAARNW